MKDVDEFCNDISVFAQCRLCLGVIYILQRSFQKFFYLNEFEKEILEIRILKTSFHCTSINFFRSRELYVWKL